MYFESNRGILRFLEEKTYSESTRQKLCFWNRKTYSGSAPWTVCYIMRTAGALLQINPMKGYGRFWTVGLNLDGPD